MKYFAIITAVVLVAWGVEAAEKNAPKLAA